MENESENIQFWHEEVSDKGQITIFIIKADFIRFLEKRGYRKLLQDKDFKLVKIKEKSIVVAVKEHAIREEVKNYLREINRKDVWEVFLGQDYLSKKFIEGIDSISIDFDYGTDAIAVFFYRNGVLNVSSKEIKIISYNEYDGYVWENQILPRDYVEGHSIDGEFKQFCYNISGQKQDRMLALQTLIGYTLHTYKDPSLTKAVILIDENIDVENNRSEGGTGKSLIAESIKQIIPTLRKNGKLLKANDKFFFSDVEPHHKVIVFDDVRADFSFEALYSMITGDMPIEKKYKNPTVMDFKDVPKVLITSNYVVSGTGGNSEKRRKVTFEVNSHYLKMTPLEEFGHRLFDDWKIDDWREFDGFMIFCVQEFLSHGLIEAQPINVVKNRLIQETHPQFVVFMDSMLDKPQIYGGEIKEARVRFDKSKIFNKLIAFESNMQSIVSPITFKKWIDIYAESNNIKIQHQKSGGSNYVIFFDVLPELKNQLDTPKNIFSVNDYDLA